MNSLSDTLGAVAVTTIVLILVGKVCVDALVVADPQRTRMALAAYAEMVASGR